MRRWTTLLAFSLAVAMPAVAARRIATEASAETVHPLRVTELFDADWQFLRGDQPGAERPNAQDSAWQTLNLPHDWSIAGPFSETNKTGAGGAFLPAGIGWYRKHFVLPPTSAHKRIFLEFDGVMANSDVWINGVHLGHRPYGYVSFRYELTDHLRFGAGLPNVVAVRCDNSLEPASRWAPGAGIYRHVHLIETDDLHVAGWGAFVSMRSVSDARAVVQVQSTIENQSDRSRQASLRIALFSPDGRLVAQAVTAAQRIDGNGEATITQELRVERPDRWDLDHPVLYRAVIHVLSGGEPTDEQSAFFGIREFHFDAATGFWLNGRNFKIKGACLHAEDGAFGAAVPLGAWKHRLEALRQLGVNAIRTAHNPPSPEFLDLCDRMGFLVMDELFDCWTVGKSPYDYHLYFESWYRADARDTVLRDRNHPSIILWSAGNEIHDTPNAVLAHRILASLVRIFHENDPTRPVTMALFRPNASHDYENGLADLLDVVGQNYRENEILAAHAQKPTRKILGTENGHDRRAWLALRDHASYAGQFLWSGADYLGEAHVWPYIANSSGLLDRTDYPHVRGLERQSWWSTTPMVRIVRRIAPPSATPTDPGETTDPKRPRETLFADWTPATLSEHSESVEVYSNAEQVELMLNGMSLGSKLIHGDASPRTWEVPFAPGTLKAIATNGSRVVATDELRTAGKPARIVLAAHRGTLAFGWNYVDYITAIVADDHGVVVPQADNRITFQVKGPGMIAAVDNADNTSHESFQGDQRSAYQGRCIAVLKARTGSGRITVVASSPGLVSGTASVRVVKSAP